MDLNSRIATDDEIKQRIEARKSAEVIFELAEQQANEVELPALFWRKLLEMCLTKTEKRIDQSRMKPMTDIEARRFGHTAIEFGEFVGQLVKDIPLDRLDWYGEHLFIDQLRRYLKSNYVKRERT